MDPNISNTMDPTGDKRLPETGVHTNISHNMTTIQKIQHLQTVGNITATNVSTIQSGQTVNAVASSCNTIVGESINQKLPFIKSNIQSGSTQFSNERGKITTLCQPVRLMSPGTLTNVERQTPVQGQGQTQQIQASQQVVTTLSATYHVPRGPAAVANISAPRSTPLATPIIRATGQSSLPILRPGVNTTVSNQPQWANKTPLIYAQSPRHPVGRITNRPPAVYSAQTARIVAPGHVRTPVPTTTIVQSTVVPTVTTGAPTRLPNPVLQSNNALTRNTGSQVRPTGPQITNPIVQPNRHQQQTIQTNQIVRTLSGTPTTTNRVTVTTSAVATASRITSVTASGAPALLNRQLTINSPTGPTQTTFGRVVTQALQQVQPSQIQGHPINTARAVPAMLPNISGVQRVITTSNSSNTRVTPSQQAPVGRLAGMTLHSVPLSRPQQPPPAAAAQTTTTTTTSTIKTIPGQIQLKTNLQPLRVTPSNIPTTIVTTSSSLLSTPPPPPSSTTATIIMNTNNNNSNNNNNNNNINSPTQLSQGSMYTQYRPVTTPLSTPPMRITSAYIVESSHDDTHGKPNASPRPSILRKRDHDNSPAKNIAKNLAPVLALLQASPPLSPPRDRESGNQSSGSTTVSATSSPGLDDEPEQSRITIINQTMEMSPRKKPRKQQLTGVELTESRCTEEEMQFITEDKLKRDTINDNIIKDKYCINRKTNIHLQNDGHIGVRHQTDIIKRRPRPGLLGSSWKSRCNSRLHHYRRPSDVRPKEERRPTVAEIGQQKHVLQKIDGWKVYQLTAQMEDLAELEQQVHERFKAQLVKFESQQTNKNRQDDGNDSEKMLSDRVNELIKGNMQRSSLISEGIIEARSQLITIFQHKSHVNEILQRCGNTKRSQKKRDK